MSLYQINLKWKVKSSNRENKINQKYSNSSEWKGSKKPDVNNAIDRSDWVNCSLTVCKAIEILQGSFAMTKILLELLVSIQAELTQKKKSETFFYENKQLQVRK